MYKFKAWHYLLPHSQLFLQRHQGPHLTNLKLLQIYLQQPLQGHLLLPCFYYLFSCPSLYQQYLLYPLLHRKSYFEEPEYKTQDELCINIIPIQNKISRIRICLWHKLSLNDAVKILIKLLVSSVRYFEFQTSSL